MQYAVIEFAARFANHAEKHQVLDESDESLEDRMDCVFTPLLVLVIVRQHKAEATEMVRLALALGGSGGTADRCFHLRCDEFYSSRIFSP